MADVMEVTESSWNQVYYDLRLNMDQFDKCNATETKNAFCSTNEYLIEKWRIMGNGKVKIQNRSIIN